MRNYFIKIKKDDNYYNYQEENAELKYLVNQIKTDLMKEDREIDILEQKIEKIKEQIKIFWKAENADDSFAAIEQIEKILAEKY